VNLCGRQEVLHSFRKIGMLKLGGKLKLGNEMIDFFCIFEKKGKTT
jgi:hypothetical protein